MPADLSIHEMNGQKTRVLISTFANPSASPRPKRMIEHCLAAGYEVSLFSLSPSSHFNVHSFFPLSHNLEKWQLRRKIAAISIGIGYHILRTKKLREKLIELAYGLGSTSQPFENSQYQLLIVEDLFLLPYCLRRGRGASIVFDAREFYPKQREGEFLFEIFERPIREWLCKTYLTQCAKVFTVSAGLAEAYKKQYATSAELLRSTPNYVAPLKQTNTDHTRTIRLVHLGGANPNRRIEKMIDVYAKLKSGFSFDIYLSGNKTYIQKLKRLAKDIKGITIHPPIAPENIIPTLQNYDIGFYYLEPNGFNLEHCLPNKFFEFIQARLAIAIGPSPEMKPLVKEFECGFIADKFEVESMASTLNGLDKDQINRAKAGSNRAAKILCAENEWKRLDQTLNELSNHGTQ